MNAVVSHVIKMGLVITDRSGWRTRGKMKKKVWQSEKKNPELHNTVGTTNSTMFSPRPLQLEENRLRQRDQQDVSELGQPQEQQQQQPQMVSEQN